MRRLVAAGFGTPDAMRAAGEDVVRKALNHRGAFAALWAKVKGDEEPARTPERYPTPTVELLRVAEPIAPYEASEPPSEPPAPHLVVDLREQHVTYRGHIIPTRPPNHLQRQPLLALRCSPIAPARSCRWRRSRRACSGSVRSASDP